MKKLFKIGAGLAFLTALFVTLSVSGENNSSMVSLSSLATISEANAECLPPEPSSPSAKCIANGEVCVWAVSHNDCHPN